MSRAITAWCFDAPDPAVSLWSLGSSIISVYNVLIIKPKGMVNE